MSVRLWTRSVRPDYPYEQLVQEMGWKDTKDITLGGTSLGTGVGIEDTSTGDGFLVFDGKDETYTVYYWRNA